MESIVQQLYKIGAIKFGHFTLKSGIESPIYIDLRLIISYPNLLKAISEKMWDALPSKDFDCLCGVPYTALPFACYLSMKKNISMIMRRKEKKKHGTKQIIEGVCHEGARCLVVEDLITSGASLFETIKPLEDKGLIIQELLVFLDRQQGGRLKLEEKGYNVSSVITIDEALQLLEKEALISKATKEKTLGFLWQAQLHA